MSNELRNFLALSYEELEELNLTAKKQRLDRVAAHKIQEERIKYLTDEKRIKAVTGLYRAARKRLAAGDGLVGVLLCAGRCVRFGQGAGVRRGHRQRRVAVQR